MPAWLDMMAERELADTVEAIEAQIRRDFEKIKDCGRSYELRIVGAVIRAENGGGPDALRRRTSPRRSSILAR